MSWTKLKLVQQGYGALGLGAMAFSLTPEMIEQAVDTLDAMMASWGTHLGIRIGYNGASDPSVTDASTESGIPDHANQAVYLGLGELLGGQIGKPLTPANVIARKTSFDMLVSWCQSQNIPEMQYRRGTPSGAGNKPDQFSGRVFLNPVEQIEAGADSFIDGDGGTPFTP